MKNIQLLEDLYQSAISKRKEAREGIIQNEDRIREIDRFLSSAKDAEEDIRFFTPRKLDEVFGDRIQSESAERAMLIKRNENLFNIVNDFDQQISQLKEVIDELKAMDDADASTVDASVGEPEVISDERIETREDSFEEAEATTSSIFSEEAVTELSELQYRLELISSYLLLDGNRAKLELDEVIGTLSEIIHNVSRDTIDE